MVRVKKTSEIWQIKVMMILYSDVPCNANYFKIKWLDTKTKDRVMDIFFI